MDEQSNRVLMGGVSLTDEPLECLACQIERGGKKELSEYYAFRKRCGLSLDPPRHEHGRQNGCTAERPVDAAGGPQ